MKITTFERKTEVDIADDKTYGIGIEKLLAVLQGGRITRCDSQGNVLESVSAGAAREATGEDILDFIEKQGGKVNAIERDPETGLILSIEASASFDTEYDSDEMAEVWDSILESVSASAALPTQITGDLAQSSLTTSYTGPGSTASTTAVTLTATITGVTSGKTYGISGAGIPAGTTCTVSGTAVTLSQAATATATGVALTFTLETQVIGLAEWTISWKRKTVESTTTDNQGYESSLGSNASWTVKSKYMFIVGDTSQTNAVVAQISNPGPPQYWNFFPTVAVSLPAYSGYAIIDGIDITAGSGKIVGLDVSLKGTGPLYVGTQIAPIATTNTLTGTQAEV